MKKRIRGERWALAHCCTQRVLRVRKQQGANAQCASRDRKQQGAYAPRSPQRDGSTLMIVIALLAMLSLVGVVFYTFAAQERSNSEYFAESAKDRVSNGLPVDIFFDWALEQLIVGPDDSLKQSALWGKNHSMIPNMFGRDAHPFSGAGVNLITDNSGNLFVDQNYNGIPDDGRGTAPNKEPNNSNLLNFNVSPAARGGATLNLAARFPRDIDVDYTYPDINNLFVSYDGLALNTGGVGSRWRRVIVPSFHRPQYLRSGGSPIADWYTNPATATRVLRPHPLHKNVVGGSFRFLGADGKAGVAGTDDDGDGDTDFETDGVTPDLSECGWTGSDDFPFIPVEVAGSAPQRGQMGVWTNWMTPARDNTYELDVDNDGDGTIKEGVWLDLDFPVQKFADGTEYIPLFSFTCIDVDSLLNLNVHGNSPKLDDVVIDGSRFGGNRLISMSNQGISPGEVNLQYALHAAPTAASWDFGGNATALNNKLEPYRLFFGRNPADRQELANMEYFFLTRGRPSFSGTGTTQNEVNEIFPGRYGEHLTTLFNAIRQTAGNPMNAGNFPQPGITGTNDQGTADPNRESPRFVHPLAYNGLGSYWQSSAYRSLDLVQPFSGSSNPSVWLQYNDYQLKNFSTPFWGVNLVGAGANSNLLAWPLDPPGTVHRNASVDDAMEIVVERDSLKLSDSVFGTEETAYAQLSQGDRNTINLTTRLDNLLPFSQGAVDIHSKRATSKRVTADSWDRKQFGYSQQFVGQRRWEINRNVGDVTGDGLDNFAFPPSFRPVGWDGTPPAMGGNGQWNTGKNREPFRDVLTSLLAVVNGSTRRGRPQFRLNLNRLLYSPAAGRLNYQQLTDPAVNQRQAQRDRQKMCRDIYVLLYTLGGGRDGANYADMNDHSNTMTLGDPNDFVYTRAQLRQMAQFAVNLVDAMDRDRVITTFEYDKNLGKTVDSNDPTKILRAGWNLDDLPWDRVQDDDGLSNDFTVLVKGDRGYDPDYPQDSIERGVVHGVEAQLMTLSEALWVRVPQDPVNDSKLTLYDEKIGRHEHLFVEMRNASPFKVRMALDSSNTAARGTWRLRLKFDKKIDPNGTFPEQIRTLTFLKNAGPYLNKVRQQSVVAGGQFTIGASNGQDRFPDKIDPTKPGNEHRPADLRIDFDGTLDEDDYPLVVPPFNEPSPPTKATSANDFPKPKTDLDLVHNRDEVQKFAINGDFNPATNKGVLLAGIDDFVIGFTLVLERRANLTRSDLNDNENPWIEVDRMWVPAKRLAINSTTENNILPELAKLKSSERKEPLTRRPNNTELLFDPTQALSPPVASQRVRFNTIGKVRNTRSPSRFTKWQQHFDRDFASVGELLGIPLYGPNDVTKYAGGSHQSGNNTWKHRPPIQEHNLGRYPLTAASLMLQSRHPSNISNPMPNAQLDNRWYRLLEFVEVPTRTHLALGNPLDIARVPGRLAINMMRNPESWAGLIDDSNVVDLGTSYLNNPAGGFSPMPGKQEGTTRDWWEQLMAARDRRDPVTGLYLPGTASSRPFRSLSYMADGNSSIEHTLLRQLPNDESNGNSNRRLLEIGNTTEHQNGSVDPYIRHRLLSKVWGNSTTRSHVFVVFVSVDFFAAKDMGNGAVRVGKRLDATSVEHRGVFVINRARIEEATKPGTTTVDWRKLIDFRQTIK